MKSGRGMLSSEIQAIAKEHLGREITVRELRLMPYLCHVLLNDQFIDPKVITVEEYHLLCDWQEQGWVTSLSFLYSSIDATPVMVSPEFWAVMTEILYHGYVDC